MACKQTLAILAALLVALPALARATEHVVGDYSGWTTNFNYSAWAEGREFRVGDTLVFKYAVGKHNVFNVGGPDFKACNVPPESEAMTSGDDVITLMTPGRKWYICGKAYGRHCQAGQKLFINVLPAEQALAPAPYYPSPLAWEAPAPVPAPEGTPYTGPTQHIVGDEEGWTLNFNYTAWAEGRTFYVGDTLVFKYGVGVHNVFKVSGSAFEHCSVPPEWEAMATGSDVVTLATPGKKWYICGKAEGRHCWSGMKLVIVVLPVPSAPPAPAPAYSPPSGPTQFTVGDEMGWTLNFNYTAWAEGKVFRVGDSLVFRYAVGNHNVFRVDGPAFKACNVPPESEPLATGNDVITLASPGRKWYICGKASGGHCRQGQKLFIDVLPAAGQAFSPSPPSPNVPGHHYGYGRRLLK